LPINMKSLLHATTNEEIFDSPRRDAYALGVRAYVWGFPLVETARIRIYGTNPADPFAHRPPTSTGAPLNRWGHQLVPADHTFRAGVGPSVDLLYSSLRLDLSEEPFVVEVPDCGPRYYTVQIAYADSSADQSYGQRTHGGELPPLFLQGPRNTTRAPAGMLDVRCPTRYCLLPARFLFDPADPTDLDRVRALQRQLTARPLSSYLRGSNEPPSVPAQRPLVEPGVRPWAELLFFHELGNVLRDWIVQPTDRELVDQLAGIALTPAGGFRPQDLSGSTLDDLARAFRDGGEIVRRKSLTLGDDLNGWTCNRLGPRFGDDRLLRAGVAKDQILVTVPEEALYPVGRLDEAGEPLDGRNAYRLLFPGDNLPPVDAFWSVTLYGDDGFLVDNPLRRYAISDRTPGLQRLPDGGIEVAIGSRPPPEDSVANWLPAPAARFYLMLRLYIPRTEVLDGSWMPPPIRRVENPVR
jgi:hypothetical protein